MVGLAFESYGRAVPGRVGSAGRRRAFNMVELLTTITIAMVISTIGFSGFRLFKRQLPVTSAATRFSNALSTARSYAIARNGFYQVTFDLDHRNFWIDEIPDPVLSPGAPPTTPKVVSPEVIDDRVRILGVTQTGSTNEVTTGLQFFIFNPDGSADRDVRVRLIQIAEDPAVPGNVVTIRLYGPTGHSKVMQS